jgi:SAM-dependent methyltransferase
VDLAVGDSAWDYSRLQTLADLNALPFAAASFDACLNIVTLEHVPTPGAALTEMGRVLIGGGSLLLVVPHEWEVHQAPHDYFRFTRHGIRYLLESAGFQEIRIEPVGGFFRLLSRRLLNGLQFFPVLLLPFAALLLVPPALVLPVFDALDRERSFTLGYICTARKSS